MPYFEYRGSEFNTFWEIEQADTQLTITWGRVGHTSVHVQTKTFSEAAAAKAAMDKRIFKKQKKAIEH